MSVEQIKSSPSSEVLEGPEPENKIGFYKREVFNKHNLLDIELYCIYPFSLFSVDRPIILWNLCAVSEHPKNS
jgi:hypothetical protein